MTSNDVELVIDRPALIRWIRGRLTQDDVAAVCRIKNHTLVSYWETGEREPTEQQWRSLLELGRRLQTGHTRDIGAWLRVEGQG